MNKKSYDVEAARINLAQLLERAQRGEASVITKHGKAIAAVVPVETLSVRPRLQLLALKGSGKGLWGKRPSKVLDRVRDEWI